MLHNHLFKKRIPNGLINLIRNYSLITKPSLSHLGTTFNQKLPSDEKSNQFSYAIPDFKKLLTSINLNSVERTGKESIKGLFGLNHLDHYDGFYELQENAKKRIIQLSKEANDYDLNSNNRKRNLVHIFDDISNELCRVADLAEFIRTSHPDMSYRQAANMVSKLNDYNP